MPFGNKTESGDSGHYGTPFDTYIIFLSPGESVVLLSKRDKYQKNGVVRPDSRYKRQKGEDVRGRE